MCVKITSDILVAKEDIVVYKVVRKKHDKVYLSQYDPSKRLPQGAWTYKPETCGTEIEYKINQKNESSFETTEGIYSYTNDKHVIENFGYIMYVILKCIVPKNTRYKTAICYNNNYRIILSEKLIPLEIFYE